MELRNHPIMVCDGMMVWPPKWLQTYGPTNCTAIGEVGTLEAVFLSQVTISKVYLSIRTQDGNCYMGTLLFEKNGFAKAMFELLYAHRNKTIRDIAAIDVPENFGNGN